MYRYTIVYLCLYCQKSRNWSYQIMEASPSEATWIGEPSKVVSWRISSFHPALGDKAQCSTWLACDCVSTLHVCGLWWKTLQNQSNTASMYACVYRLCTYTWIISVFFSVFLLIRGVPIRNSSKPAVNAMLVNRDSWRHLAVAMVTSIIFCDFDSAEVDPIERTQAQISQLSTSYTRQLLWCMNISKCKIHCKNAVQNEVFTNWTLLNIVKYCSSPWNHNDNVVILKTRFLYSLSL
jgi:hypothetical protein